MGTLPTWVLEGHTGFAVSPRVCWGPRPTWAALLVTPAALKGVWGSWSPEEQCASWSPVPLPLSNSGGASQRLPRGQGCPPSTCPAHPSLALLGPAPSLLPPALMLRSTPSNALPTLGLSRSLTAPTAKSYDPGRPAGAPGACRQACWALPSREALTLDCPPHTGQAPQHPRSAPHSPPIAAPPWPQAIANQAPGLFPKCWMTLPSQMPPDHKVRFEVSSLNFRSAAPATPRRQEQRSGVPGLERKGQQLGSMCHPSVEARAGGRHPRALPPD